MRWAKTHLGVVCASSEGSDITNHLNIRVDHGWPRDGWLRRWRRSNWSNELDTQHNLFTGSYECQFFVSSSIGQPKTYSIAVDRSEQYSSSIANANNVSKTLPIAKRDTTPIAVADAGANWSLPYCDAGI